MTSQTSPVKEKEVKFPSHFLLEKIRFIESYRCDCLLCKTNKLGSIISQTRADTLKEVRKWMINIIDKRYSQHMMIVKLKDFDNHFKEELKDDN